MFSNLANNPESYIFAINIYGYHGLRFETAGISVGIGDLERVHAIEDSLPEDGRFMVSPIYKRHYIQHGEKFVLSFYRQLLDINELTNRLGILGSISMNEG